jgi:hypothetical protein
MKVVAEADEKKRKRKRMMPGSSVSGGLSDAPPKYHMVYTLPRGQLRRLQQQQNWGNHPQFQLCGNSSSNNRNSNSSNSTMLLLCHHSRLPSGRHSSFPLVTSLVSTTGRWGTLLVNAVGPNKATHSELWHLWSISRGANRGVQHDKLAMLTTPPWVRFPWEKKSYQVHSSSMNAPLLYCSILEHRMIL